MLSPRLVLHLCPLRPQPALICNFAVVEETWLQYGASVVLRKVKSIKFRPHGCAGLPASPEVAPVRNARRRVSAEHDSETASEEFARPSAIDLRLRIRCRRADASYGTTCARLTSRPDLLRHDRRCTIEPPLAALRRTDGARSCQPCEPTLCGDPKLSLPSVQQGDRAPTRRKAAATRGPKTRPARWLIASCRQILKPQATRTAGRSASRSRTPRCRPAIRPACGPRSGRDGRARAGRR